MATETDLDCAETLKERADDDLTRDDIGTLVDLLDSDSEEARGVAARALSSYSKDHPSDLLEYASEFRSRVTEPDQDSTRQSHLGETLSQIGLVAPKKVAPVAETLFEFTMKPWRFFSFTDGVVSAAVEDDRVLDFLRSQIDSGSKAERNNAHLALSRVAEKAPDRVAPHLSEFIDVVEDDSEYLKIRGHAAKTYGLAASTSTTVRPTDDALSMLLESRDSIAVKGSLAALVAITEHPSMYLASELFIDRLEVLADGDDEEVSLWSEDRQRVETVRKYLADRTRSGDEASGSAAADDSSEETQVFGEAGNTEVAPADVGGNADRSGSISFCPNCGEDLRQWSDLSFCSDCGFEF